MDENPHNSLPSSPLPPSNQREKNRIEAQKRYLERQKEERKKINNDVEKLGAKNHDLKIEYTKLKESFGTLLPRLCNHDKLSAKQLWEIALSGQNAQPKVMPHICGCNED